MRNFIIFGQGRSGSNLLVHLLSSHPQIQCDGEILGRQSWLRGIEKPIYGILRQFPFPYIDWKASRSPLDVYGFKLFIHHIPAVGRMIHAAHARDWQIVHIQRRSLFDQALSRVVAMVTNHWLGFDQLEEPDTVSVTIPPVRLLAMIQQCVRRRQKILHVLKDVPHILVTYEEDLLDEAARNRICGTIFQAVGVEQRPVSNSKQRSWARPYRELIVNYDELLDLMATAEVQALQAEWEQLFDFPVIYALDKGGR